MCNICKGKTELIGQTKEKPWVISNGSRLHANIHLHICLECGHVQKNVDDELQNLIENTFKDYQVNSFDSNIDQMSFQNNGNFSSRLGFLVEKIKHKNILKKTGRLLEIGSAQGLFLKEFHKEFPEWALYAQDYDNQNKYIILNIDSVKDFYTKDDKITTNMNCIAMNHVLNVIPLPADILHTHHNLLEDSGIHFVQVPDYLKDPFDLCIADTYSHFTRTSLNYLAKECGYSIISTTDGWTQKHVGWLATKSTPCTYAKMDIKTVEVAKNNVLNILKWLDELPFFILEYAKGKELGILGTATAASWVAESINNINIFFVDEDPHRQGKDFLGKIIYAPNDCPSHSCVFLPFAPELTKKIKERLTKEYPRIDFFYFNKELLS